MSDSGLESQEVLPCFAYVLGSTVRQSLVATLRRHDRTTTALIDGTEFSDSAVYNALTDLEDYGLIVRRTDQRWKLTGTGQLLADWTAVADRTEALVRADKQYWERHDASVLPPVFRRELSVLQGCEIVRAAPTNPQAVQNRVTDLLAEAESVSVMTEVQHPQYATAVEERAEITSPVIVFDSGVVEASDAGRYRRPDEWAEDVTLRVHENIEFTVAVVDDRVILSLPTLDGVYDMYTEVIAGGEALEWGRRLFDRYYAESVPMEEFVASDGSPGEAGRTG